MILERAGEENTSDKKLDGRSDSVDQPGRLVVKQYK